MAIRVGRDTLFQDRHGKWFVKFRQGSGASAKEVVVAIERVTRVQATLAARYEVPRDEEGGDDGERDDAGRDDRDDRDDAGE